MSKVDTADDPWMAAMRRGDFAAAWQVSDKILRSRLASKEPCWHWPRHLQYIWRGESFAGKRVLVRCYHGLGDTIQFVRFMKPLRDLARHVTVWVQPPLLEMTVGVAGIDEVLPLHDGAPDAEFDLDIEIMEVPHALRVNAIPSAVPYLTRPGTAQPRADATLHVGLAWKGGDWDQHRNLPAALLQCFADVSGVRLFSLQPGLATASLPVVQVDCSTITKTAAKICELDLVISVDTMVAHLAGALGRPVWTMLQAHCDWRWGSDRRSTVWYPTMRLFRQSRQGDWSPVIEQICAALGAQVNERSRCRR